MRIFDDAENIAEWIVVTADPARSPEVRSERLVTVTAVGRDAALARGDLASVLDLIDENIVITGQITPDGRPAQGREGLLANVKQVNEAFEELTYEPLELIDLGERVLAHVRVFGTGRQGITGELKFGQIWTIQNGKAVRVDNYTDWEDALQASAAMPGDPNAAPSNDPPG